MNNSHSRRGGFQTLPYSVAIGLILLLAFALRVHLLGSQSLWNDEGSSYVQATRSLGEIARNAALDIHPPGYYWLLKFWRDVSGDSEFALRSLSAFASLLSVAFTFAIGRRLYPAWAGLAAALFVALNSFSIYYAQEARMYALLALWGAAGFWALLGFMRAFSLDRAHGHAPLRRPLLMWALGLGLINAAGLWTQYVYPFVMLAQGAVFVVWLIEHVAQVEARRAVPLQRIVVFYIAANLLTMALYLPWLPTALARVTSWPNTGEALPLPLALQAILGWFSLGITFQSVDPSWVAVGVILLLLGLRRSGQTLWRMSVPVLWVVVPVTLFLALNMYRPENLKLLLPAQIGFALWLGRGLWVLWGLGQSSTPIPASRGTRETASSDAFKSLPVDGEGFRVGSNRKLARLWLPRLAALALALGLSVNLARGLQPLYHDAAYQRDGYRAMAAEITASQRPGDAVILDAPNQAEVFGYYYQGDAPVFSLPEGLGGDDAATQARVEQIIADYERIFVLFWGEAERDPQRIVETTLDQQAFQANSQWYGDVRLLRYSTPVEPHISEASGAHFGQSITLQSFSLSDDSLHAGDVLQVQLEWQTDSGLDTRYKVFLQLLDAQGQLVAQRDSEPGGGLALTTTWTPGQPVQDLQALILPDNLSGANYTLIVGLYNMDNPQQRLPVGDTDFLVLRQIRVE